MLKIFPDLTFDVTHRAMARRRRQVERNVNITTGEMIDTTHTPIRRTIIDLPVNISQVGKPKMCAARRQAFGHTLFPQGAPFNQLQPPRL
ncbi:hypothetical protein [Sinorhizobium psoraleae]|uniref:hypothetical protein n=1 Tax=Sinorhizobium psoraleae TaxID=520838 RepID=UPI001AEDB4D9|nr:hypothetical protein [Sinorhizobium psoraleae]